MQKFMPYSTRIRLLLASIVIEVCVLGLLLANSMRLMNQEMVTEIRSSAEQLGPALNGATAPLLAQGDYTSLRRAVASLVAGTGRGVAYLVVRDRTGAVVARAGDVDPSRLPAVSDDIGEAWSGKTLAIVRPLTLAGQPLGSITFGLATRTLAAARSDILRQGALIAAVGIALTILLLASAGYWLTRHLSRLFKGAQTIAEGRYDVLLPVEGRDEVAWVTQNFNRMTQAVRDKVEELSASEAYVRAIVNSVADGMITADEDGVIESFNPAAEKIFGYTRGETLGQKIGLLMSGPVSREHEAYMARYQATGQSTVVGEGREVEGRRKNGELFPMHIAVSEMRLGDRRKFVAVVCDISERKAAEDRLRQSEELFSKAFHANPEPVVISRLSDGRIIDVNESFVRFSGHSREEAVGRGALELGLWDRPEDRAPLVRILTEKGSVRDLELNLKTKSGTQRAVVLAAELIEIDREPCILVVARDVTEWNTAVEALRKSEESHRLIVENINEIIYMVSLVEGLPRGRVEFVSGRTEQIVGHRPEEFLRNSRLWFRVIHPEDAPAVIASTRRLLRDKATVSREYRVRHKTTGEYRWIEDKLVPRLGDDGRVTGYFGVARDVTERKLAEEALHEEKERAQVTLHSIGDAVITTDARGDIAYMNPVAERLTGWRRQEVQGSAVEDAFLLVNEVTRERLENPVRKCLREGAPVNVSGYSLLISRDGREIAIEDSASLILGRDGQVIGAVLVCHDVSHARQMAHQMSYQATHDSLTGLINRREFERRVEELLVRAETGDTVHALCYLDLDQFKVVNDTCGHVAGDELLRQLAGLLQSKVRDTDTLARLGGDEFGVLLENCPLDQAQLIAEIFRQAVRDFRFLWQNNTFVIGASIGLVPINAESVGLASVLSAADAACYAAKDSGRNRVWVYQPGDSELAQRHGEMQWVSRIHHAFEEDRFLLFCQTIVPIGLQAGRAGHYEVLLRMVDEEGRIVPPMAFIPAAERYNLMPAIDRWVVRKVFAMLGPFYRGRGRANESVFSINLSGVSLGDEELLEFIRTELLHHGVPTQHACFEITETTAIANLSNAIHFIQELKRLGLRFSLDDFGSGLSSFAYLKNLPVDYLKIDGSFIRDMEYDRINFAMVKAINNIGHEMGILTVAEFVESPAVLEKLAILGVDYAQGYQISEPRPLEQILASYG